MDGSLNNEELTVALNILTKKINGLKSDFDNILDIQKKQEKALDKQNILLTEIQQGASSGEGPIANTNSTSISKEDLSLRLRELLLEDEELLELFSKVIENITTFNHNKDKIDGYIDNQREKRKSKKPIFIIGTIIVSILLVASYFIFNEKVTIVIPAQASFYELNKKAALGVPSELSVEVVDEDENNYYFEIKNKKYSIPKASIK